MSERMSSRTIPAILVLILIIVAFSSIPLTNVHARPVYAKDLPPFHKNYCTTCHTRTSGGGLNRFGSDYAAASYDVNAISAMDSDGDGFTNSQELAAGTFPGDPASYPGASTAPIRLDAIVLMAGILGFVGVIVAALMIRILRTGENQPKLNTVDPNERKFFV